jgi:peptide/nickel transport system substrate-binding protein
MKDHDKRPDPEILRMQEWFTAGWLTRREFMQGLLATGLTVSAASALVATTPVARAAMPKKGGKITFGWDQHGPADTLDPILFTSTIDYTRGRAGFNGLLQFNDDMSMRPELAEEWSVNDNATEYTFKIRKGVTFHDGKPMTADDVVYSMSRHIAKDSASKGNALVNMISEWKKVDSHTVKAILNSPDSDLPAKLGEKQTKIVKKDTVDFKMGNGTGPFVLESFEPGVRSTHVRNENYWREGANFDAVEVTAITDPLARANALIAGDVDLINQVDSKSVALVEQAEGVRIVSTPSSGFAGICILKNTNPGENDDFVKGMQYIQDRDRIVRSILKGHGTPGNDHPIGVAFGADHCSELPQREYDPDKAKFHLGKSGITSAELHVAPVKLGIVETCLLMQANLKKIGFDLAIKKVPNDGYWGAVWMKEPLNVVSWNMRPTANSMLAIQFAPGANWNDTFWNNDRMGELLKAQLAETDPDKRHAMLCEMQGLVNTGSGMVIPYHVNILDGISDRIQGVPNVPLGAMGAYEWVEFAWMEA